jgi:hypothetical protein
VHFGQGAAKLFPLGENVFMPSESSIQVEPEVFEIICLRQLYIVDNNRLTGSMSSGEGDMMMLYYEVEHVTLVISLLSVFFLLLIY